MTNTKNLKNQMVKGTKEVVTLTNVHKSEYKNNREFDIQIETIRYNLPKNKNLLLFHDTYVIVENKKLFNNYDFYKTLIEQFGGVVEKIDENIFVATWKEYVFAFVENERHEYCGIVTKAKKDEVLTYVESSIFDLFNIKLPFEVWKAEYAGFIYEFLNLVAGNPTYFGL